MHRAPGAPDPSPYLQPEKVHLLPDFAHLEGEAQGAKDWHGAVHVQSRVDGHVDVAPVALLVEPGELGLDGVRQCRDASGVGIDDVGI